MLQLLRLEEHLQAVQQLVSRDQTKAPKEGKPAQTFPCAAGLLPKLHPSPSRTLGVFQQQQPRSADKEPRSDGPNTKGGQGTQARAKNRGTATCQNPYKR